MDAEVSSRIGAETHLDDVLSLVVNLPPGTGPGPVIPETLARWGLRSAPAYNLIINLSYRLFDPGRTRYPVRRRAHWMAKRKPEAYESISVDEIAAAVFPLSTNRNRRPARTPPPSRPGDAIPPCRPATTLCRPAATLSRSKL